MSLSSMGKQKPAQCFKNAQDRFKDFLLSILFNLFFVIFGIVSLPHFLLKLRQAEDPKKLCRERLGLFDRRLQLKLSGARVIWIHAVSVGEVMAMKQFVEGFIRRFPGFHLLVTTVTPTGQRIAKKLETDRVAVCYFPFDLTLAVRRFFVTFRPEAILLVETEIWPNLLLEAQRLDVPVGIINGRLSEKSLKRYKKIRFLTQRIMRKLDFILTQSTSDARHFADAGADPETIQCLGNMKFDNVKFSGRREDESPRMKLNWKFEPGDRIWIAGSTHEGEEKILMRAFRVLKNNHPELRLIIAPRHIERSKAIAREFNRNGFSVRLSTQPANDIAESVLILDQIGVLKDLYQIADIVFIGGSLIRRGGQNPIEAACFKLPIIHGPHVSNFQEIYRILDQEGAAVNIRDEFQLIFALKRLLDNQSECHLLGDNAFEAVQKLQGATQRHLEWFQTHISGLIREGKNDDEFDEKLFSPVGRLS